MLVDIGDREHGGSGVNNGGLNKQIGNKNTLISLDFVVLVLKVCQPPEHKYLKINAVCSDSVMNDGL